MTAMLRLVLMFIACALPHVAAAQALPDPTRPPLVPRAVGESASPAAQQGAAPILQSVLIGRDWSTAIISGQRFDVGDHVGEARIVRITETEVVLRSGEGLTTLKLFPQIEKRIRTLAPKAGAAAYPQKKSGTTPRETEA